MEVHPVGSFIMLFIATLDDLVLEPIMSGQMFVTGSLCWGRLLYHTHIFEYFGGGGFHSSAEENSENF